MIGVALVIALGWLGWWRERKIIESINNDKQRNTQ